MDDVDEETMKMVAYIAEGILLLKVGILGIIGNVAAITVFSRQHLQKNFHALMLSLSLFDLIYIVAMILVFSIKEFSDDYSDSGVYFYLLPYVLPLAQIGMTGSIYFTMAITLERYVTVCHPFYRVAHSWPWWYMVCPIVLFSIVYNIIKFFELRTKVPGVYDEYSENINATVLNGTMEPDHYSIVPTYLRVNPTYYRTMTWLNFFLLGLGPFVFLITLNTLTLKELKNLGDQLPHGPDSTANRRRDLNLAKVSLAIVFVFIICHSIKWIPNIYELMQIDDVVKGQVSWPPWVEIITNVSHLMTVFNSSVNFYIYLAKHWRIILGRPESAASERTETIRLRTSVVVHDNHHYPVHNNRSSSFVNSNHLTIPNHHEHAGEQTHMLVSADVSASANDGEPRRTTRNGEVHC